MFHKNGFITTFSIFVFPKMRKLIVVYFELSIGRLLSNLVSSIHKLLIGVLFNVLLVYVSLISWLTWEDDIVRRLTLLTYKIFFLRTFTCIIFFPFPGLAKCFQSGISHILCLYKLFFKFGFFFSSCFVLQNQLYRTTQSNHVVLHLLQCDWVLSQMFYPLLSISTCIFSSHACTLSTLTWRCIQGWICGISLKNKMP